MGYVYLLLQVDKEGRETYKIGITKNEPNKRLSNLSTGNPDQMSVLNFYESENYKKIERWMHRKYLNSKTEADNEWFNLTSSEVMSFLENCKKADDIISLLIKENPFYN